MLQDTLAEKDATVDERDTTIAALEVIISSYSVLICTHFYTHLECVNAGNSQRQGRRTYQFRGLLYQITINSYMYSATVMFLSFYFPCMYLCMYVCVCYSGML